MDKFRLVASADWHFGERVTDEHALGRLLDSVAAAEPDLALVLGDFAGWHLPEQLKVLFSSLAKLPCPVGVTFGNHDLWLKQSSPLRTAWEARESFCALARAAGLHPLDLAPVQAGPVFVCGNGGWYDYSLGDPRFSAEQYAAKRHGQAVWWDGAHVRWGVPDPEVCRKLQAELESQLEQTPPGLEPVAATHMVAGPASLPAPGDPVWDYYSGFWGSRELGVVLSRHGVRLHLHGHVHGEGHTIPAEAFDPATGVRSVNAGYEADRPFVICDRHPVTLQWTVRPGRLLANPPSATSTAR